MSDLTAIILTKNEEKNIKKCIESIKEFAKRILVIDSGSQDNTILIAKELGAEVYENKYIYYAQQFNWAIDNTNIQTKWTLRLDADERFTPELCKKAEIAIKENHDTDINGITLEAWLYFLNKKIKYGVRKKRKLMIFKTGIGRIEDRKRDAHTLINEGKSISLEERFIHYDFKDLSSFIDKYNFYSSKEVEDYIDFKTGKAVLIKNNDKKISNQRNKKFGLYYRFPKFMRARLWFIYNYYFRMGFLDGKAGYLFHYYECYWYRHLVDSKILEYERMLKGE